MIITKEQLGLTGDGIHDDTTAIQALLDKAGDVYIPDGRYLITHPLIIHDDTNLTLSKAAYLRLADHVNCSLLDNDGLYQHRTNHNITVTGGIWDGNNAFQEREIIQNENLPCDEAKYISNSLIVLMVRFVHVEHLRVSDLTFKDPTSYAIHIADVKYFTVENITLDYDLSKPNMDGIHIQGPARFGSIRGIMGDANDDHVALCANGTTRSEITHGDIEDVDIDGIYCENGYTGVRLLSRGDAIRNIHISNIHGCFRFFAVSLTHHYPLDKDKPILLENIHISDIYASKSTADFPAAHHEAVVHDSLIWLESGINCRNVVIEKVYRNERCTYTKAPTIRLSKDVNAEGMIIRDIYQTFAGEPLTALINESDSAIADLRL